MALRSRLLLAAAAGLPHADRRSGQPGRLASGRRRRIELVDAVNAVRPRTWA